MHSTRTHQGGNVTSNTSSDTHFRIVSRDAVSLSLPPDWQTGEKNILQHFFFNIFARGGDKSKQYVIDRATFHLADDLRNGALSATRIQNGYYYTPRHLNDAKISREPSTTA